MGPERSTHGLAGFGRMLIDRPRVDAYLAALDSLVDALGGGDIVQKRPPLLNVAAGEEPRRAGLGAGGLGEVARQGAAPLGEGLQVLRANLAAVEEGGIGARGGLAGGGKGQQGQEAQGAAGHPRPWARRSLMSSRLCHPRRLGRPL